MGRASGPQMRSAWLTDSASTFIQSRFDRNSQCAVLLRLTSPMPVCVRNSPDLYMDKRGNLHVLTHNQSPCYSGRAAPFFGADVRGCGAHFYSSDMGASWSFAWHAVYNGTVV